MGRAVVTSFGLPRAQPGLFGVSCKKKNNITRAMYVLYQSLRQSIIRKVWCVDDERTRHSNNQKLVYLKFGH